MSRKRKSRPARKRERSREITYLQKEKDGTVMKIRKFWTEKS